MAQGIVIEPTADPEEAKLQALIEERVSLLARQDLFGHLGLTHSATSEDVKKAFVEAVKIFHPDHLPPGLSFLADKQRELFGAIKRAYDTLSDDDRRKHYLELVRRSSSQKAP
jgi:curved DNA-binding protein CbpA